MDILYKTLAKKPIFYVTRDIERGLGLPLATPGYFIISNYSDFAKQIAEKHTNVLLVQGDKILDTAELLTNEESVRFIKNISKSAQIVVFKPTKQIEKIVAQNNWKLLNPSAELSNKIEEKVSQIAWLGELAKYLPKHRVLPTKKITWRGKPFILQFNHAHTGSGTFFIRNEASLKALQRKFPERVVRAMQYIVGPVFTNNNVVTGDSTLVGNINYQITGKKPFTKNPFSTVGNDWGMAHKLLSTKQKDQYTKIAEAIGTRLRKSGWKGLFGLDIIMDETTGKLFLIEINARQPASTTYESTLQDIQRQNSRFHIPDSRFNTLTTFEAHLASLLELSLSNYSIIPITDGAQIIFRNKLAQKNYIAGSVKKGVNFLLKEGFKVIPYSNNEPGSDLLRIQADSRFMLRHKRFNETGKKIVSIVENIV